MVCHAARLRYRWLRLWELRYRRAWGGADHGGRIIVWRKLNAVGKKQVRRRTDKGLGMNKALVERVVNHVSSSTYCILLVKCCAATVEKDVELQHLPKLV